MRRLEVWGFRRLGLRRPLAAIIVAVVISPVLAMAANSPPPAMMVPGKFDVSQTGAFNYTIPLAVPPGTGGMTPALSLDYSSSRGDGHVGLGWTLSGLPSISRCARTLAQDGVHGGVNYDSSDRFCMDGQRLVPVSAGVYRTEIESFSKIISHGTSGSGPAWFEVHTKAGQVMYFGYTEDTDNPSNGSRLTLSATNATARGWALEKVQDSKGNFLIVKYTTTYTEAYPSEIDYTGNDSASLAPFAKVKFFYNYPRLDIFPAYQAGYLTQTTVLLSNIETFVGPTLSTLVTNYKLTYNSSPNPVRHDELASISQCSDAAGTNCLKPTAFGWQGSRDTLAITPQAIGIAQDPGTTFGTITAGYWNGSGLTDVQTNTGASCDIFYGTGGGNFADAGLIANYTQWINEEGTYHSIPYSGAPCFVAPPQSKRFYDFDADGFTDFVLVQRTSATDQQIFFLRNSGASQLNQTSFYDPGQDMSQLGDFNGDSRADLIARSPPNRNMWYGNATGIITPGTLLTNNPAQAGDFDGDGCTDLYYASSNSVVFSCQPAVASTPTDNFSGGQVVLGDFNGDGKADFLVVKPGTAGTLLYLSTGTGFVQESLSVGSDWGKYQVVTGDWNGDGMTDIGLFAVGFTGGYGVGTPHSLWLSYGTGFVQEATIDNNNSADTKELAVVADWSSDGADDVWLKKPSGDTEYLLSYVPEVMTTVDNGLGIKTTITYDRLNKNSAVYQKCSTSSTYNCGDAYPTQAIDGPFYVVTRIDSSNGLGACNPPSLTNCFSSTYFYSGAKFDLTGRGFLGFAKVTITDQQTGIVQTTNYSVQFPTFGLITSQTKVCPTPVCATTITLNSTTNGYDIVSLGTGTDNVARTFLAVQQTTLVTNDLSGDPFPTTTTSYNYDCDGGSVCAGTSPTGYGNATSIVQCTFSTSCATDGVSTTTTNTYTNDATNWFLGRLITATVQKVYGASTLTRQTSYCYELSYVPSGTSCATVSTPTGLLRQEIVEPESSSDPSLKLETDYSYDPFGNKASTITKGCVWLSPTNCSTTTPTATRSVGTVFDTTALHGQFATQITNPLTQSETWAYAATNNTSFGVPSGHTGPNGLTTNWGYDVFGRKILETRADGNQTSIAYTYCTNLPSGEVCPTNTQFDVITTPENNGGTQNGPRSVTYYDGLSRVVAVDVEGFDAAGTGCNSTTPCWIRVSTQYDQDGRVAQTSRPYFFLISAAKWTVFTYDTIGRVIKAVYPDASKTTYGFNGLTTSVTNDKSQTTTTVKNVLGSVANVQDANTQTTNYTYDGYGNLLTIKDPLNNLTTNTYDIRGRKKTATDPDLGGWSYVYDGFAEIYSQTDAQSQITTSTYDALGRMLTRTEPGLTSTWIYDTASGKGIGQLASASTGSNYSRSFVYDSLGRPSSVTLTEDGTAYTYTTNYNSDGRVSTIGYPSGFTALYTYTTLGYLYQVSDWGGSGIIFWTANTRDAELHLLTQTAGNGIATTQSFDPNTGRILSTLAGTGSTVANQTYTFDTLGNLTNRTWLNNGGNVKHETACYDNLNRITSINVGSATSCTGSGAVSTQYDSIGNITQKSDICATANCMAYGSAAGPHALTSITGTYNGVTNPSFIYDGNGNMTSGGGRSIMYTSFNMASRITDGANAVSLSFDSEHSRYKQVAAGAGVGTTYYLNDPASKMMEEKFLSGSTTTWKDYIMADGQMVAQRSCVGGSPCTASPSIVYFILDHLGSVSVITDGTSGSPTYGTVLERLSYDAWGKRRNANGGVLACGATSASTTRGFTGQEMMDSVCFINFNARVYDPSLGRFMSADSIVQTPDNLQALNRYSYVFNNPLSLTDPSGNCAGIVGCFFAFLSFGLAEFAIEPLLKAVPLLGDIIVVAAAIGCGPYGPLCAAVAAAGVAGAEGGHGTEVLEAFVTTFAQAAITVGLGRGLANLRLPPAQATAAAFVAQGAIGGAFSALQGQKFASGFLAAGFGSLVGPIAGTEFSPSGAVIAATLGGIGSVLGGGKFENGAITGAFAYAAANWSASNMAVDAGPSQGGEDPELDRKNCNCDRILPDPLIKGIANLRAHLEADSDGADLIRLANWDIEYEDVDRGVLYGKTMYQTQVTDIYAGMKSLSQDQVNFLVAHEFAHLLPSNYALYAHMELADALTAQLNNTAIWESNANFQAMRLLHLTQIPTAFACYGRGLGC